MDSRRLQAGPPKQRVRISSAPFAAALCARGMAPFAAFYLFLADLRAAETVLSVSHARFSTNAAWYLVPTNMPDQAKGRAGKSSAPLLPFRITSLQRGSPAGTGTEILSHARRRVSCVAAREAA